MFHVKHQREIALNGYSITGNCAEWSFLLTSIITARVMTLLVKTEVPRHRLEPLLYEELISIMHGISIISHLDTIDHIRKSPK